MRVVSAVLVLGILVLIVAESAKYLNEVRVPKAVSLKLEALSDKIASVSSFNFKSRIMGSLARLESFTGVEGPADSSSGGGSLAVTGVGGKEIFRMDGGYDYGADGFAQGKQEKPDVAGTFDSRSSDSVASFEASPAEVVSRIAVLSDAHNDLDHLRKALHKAKKLGADRVVFLGDYTDWGELDKLFAAKEVMDSVGLEYASLPGDHDLGQTRDESNFVKVFGKTYGVFKVGDIKFTYYDNSKNYTKLSPAAISWFQKEIQDTDFLFLSQPLVTSSMSRVMGIINGVKDLDVFAQNNELVNMIRSSKVRVIISGDLHQFSQFRDPVRSDLWHYSVGAILKTQSLEKLNLQSPRFCVLEIKADKSYKVTDVPID